MKQKEKSSHSERSPISHPPSGKSRRHSTGKSRLSLPLNSRKPAAATAEAVRPHCSQGKKLLLVQHFLALHFNTSTSVVILDEPQREILPIAGYRCAGAVCTRYLGINWWRFARRTAISFQPRTFQCCSTARYDFQLAQRSTLQMLGRLGELGKWNGKEGPVGTVA